MTHFSRDIEKMGQTAQTMVRTSQESARIFTDYTVKAQELNTQLAQRSVETWIDGLRKQTELSQDMAQALFGKAEEQAEVYRSFFEKWGHLPIAGFPFGGNNITFPFQKQGMRLVDTATKNAEETLATATFPIAGYDEKNVEEISKQLDFLTDEQVRQLKAYERKNKNRQSLIERFDSKLRAS